MSTIRFAILREVRVAFSRRAQPVWFRIVKWLCILAAVALFHDRRWLWWTLAGLAVAGVSLHLIYRWKTKAWTRAWGGWNDLEAGLPTRRQKHSDFAPVSRSQGPAAPGARQ